MIQRASKKTETLEVRLSHEAKAAFMADCAGRAETASDAIRTFIEQRLEGGRPRGGRSLWIQAGAAALAGLVLGAVAAPSLAQTAPGSRAAFERLDRDHDGALSYAEFHAR